MSLIDFHSHILPAIDDGSKNAEMSAEMIKGLINEGVGRLVLTPHFYASEGGVDRFLERRERSFERLRPVLGDFPELKTHLGAEVFYMDSLDRVDGFERLCIEGTDYMLLEMPFSKWTQRTLDTVQHIISSGVTPIIAHFERYIPIQGGMDKIYTLRSMGCILQMNAEAFKGFFNKRKAVGFFADKTASLLGSDCHNLSSRPPEIRAAYDAIEQKLGAEKVNEILSLGERILG